MFSFFCVGKFWQMMLASARIYVGQENFLWHVFLVLFVGVFWQMMFASARMDAGQSNIVSRKQYMSCCLLGCFSKRCLIVLAFVLDMNIPYDIISVLLLCFGKWCLLVFASARSFVGQGNIVWPILLVVWGFSASDVCRCSHLCWARKCSMTRFPCLFVWVFWQMMFASARICAGQENIIWHVFIVLSSVGFSLRFWLLWISTLGCGSECHTCSCCLRWLWGKSGSELDCLDLYLWHLVSKWRRCVGGKASSGGNLLCWKT